MRPIPPFFTGPTLLRFFFFFLPFVLHLPLSFLALIFLMHREQMTKRIIYLAPVHTESRSNINLASSGKANLEGVYREWGWDGVKCGGTRNRTVGSRIDISLMLYMDRNHCEIWQRALNTHRTLANQPDSLFLLFPFIATGWPLIYHANYLYFTYTTEQRAHRSWPLCVWRFWLLLRPLRYFVFRLSSQCNVWRKLKILTISQWAFISFECM